MAKGQSDADASLRRRRQAHQRMDAQLFAVHLRPWKSVPPFHARARILTIMLAPLSNFNEVRCSDAGCVPAAPAPPTVTFALNSRVPSAALATTAARACDVENDILGCAHDTWIPLLAPGVANVAILLDCGAANQSVTLWPTAAHVSSACMTGGVCQPAQTANGAKRCWRGTFFLFRWLHSSFSSDFYLEIDSDTVVFDPAAIASWWLTRLRASGATGDPGVDRLYGGRHHGSPPFLASCHSPHLLRAIDAGWIALESSIAGWDVSAAARRQRFGHDHQVIYASGGSYCLSRAALNAIASHRCVERVAAIGANRSAGGEYSLRHEDAAVGVCAHLVGARLDTSLGAVCMLRVGGGGLRRRLQQRHQAAAARRAPGEAGRRAPRHDRRGGDVPHLLQQVPRGDVRVAEREPGEIDLATEPSKFNPQYSEFEANAPPAAASSGSRGASARSV